MKKLSFLILTVIFSINITNAESFVNNTNKLYFDISGVSEFVKSSAEAVTGVFTKEKSAEQKNIPIPSFSKVEEEQQVTKIERKDMNVCEVYDATFLNVLILDSASTEASQKIDKIQDTIDDEILLREGIFEAAASLKKLSTLLKSERVVFREMKKALEEAKIFYKSIEEMVNDVGVFLEDTDCEDLKPKVEKILNGHYLDTDSMIQEESIFRKQFSSSLKDKMLVLQKEAKEIKGGKK